MPQKAPAALNGQLETLVMAAEAAARWFRVPSRAALSAAQTARLRARRWRQAAVTAVRSAHGPVKSEALALSFALREAVEQTALSVSEASRWNLVRDEDFVSASTDLKDSVRALMAAVSGAGPERAEALIEAKRRAAAVERRRRAVSAEGRESVSFVESAKRGEVSLRLSSAAEAVQQACDALAGSLAE